VLWHNGVCLSYSLTNIVIFNAMNVVWDAWVALGNTPARAAVEAKLAAPSYKVEIMVVAGC
jgi:enamine deaminase RidA (YjgF/YER057c/UK114 family)